MINQKIYDATSLGANPKKDRDSSNNMDDFKGSYFNKKPESHSHESGAHFSYRDLFHKLEVIVKERNDRENKDKDKNNDEGISILI